MNMCPVLNEIPYRLESPNGAPGCSTMGIVLAGSHPWTKSAFDKLIPRALLPIAHRPLIWFALTWLREAGIENVAVCANRETRALQEPVARHIPDGMKLSYHEDSMPRGAAGSFRDAAATSSAEAFVVTDGSAIPTVDLPALLAAHQSSGATVTVVVDAECCQDGKGALQSPSGTYVFNRRAIERVPARGFYDIKETLIPQLYREGERIVAYRTDTPSPRVLSPTTYLAVNEWALERLAPSRYQSNGYVRCGDSLIHEDAMVAADALLVGPALVGPNARIMSGAVVVGPTSIGRGATIRQRALVSHSAVWRRAVVGAEAVVFQCIVADDAIVGAHSQALRSVIVAGGQQLARMRDASRHVGSDETLPAEIYRRVVRSLAGASWLRSPAAQ